MREIKFRAWDKENKWMDVGPFWIGNDGCVWDEPQEMFDTPNVEINPNVDLVIMQYTGLKDKNGMEIYEGDIYKLTIGDKYWVHVVKTFTQFGNVLFGALLYTNFYTDEDTNEFVYEISYKNAGVRSFVHSGKEVELIGNIYENPELLEKL